MLNGLQEEINNNPLFINASKNIIMNYLNTPGTFKETYTDDSEWVVSETPSLISKSELMTKYLSMASGQSLCDFMEIDQSFNKYINRIFTQVEGSGIDLTLQSVREIFTYLYETFNICTETEFLNLMQIGERQLSRAEELTNIAEGTARFLTLEDFE